MARRLRLFISATSDLQDERHAISKALAQFPVPLGWLIKRTPDPGDQTPETLASAIRQSDFFVLLLGADVHAPVGSELLLALNAGITPRAYVKDVAHTLAARTFRRGMGLDWTRFSASEHVARLLTHDLIREILERATDLEVSAAECRSLSEALKDGEKGRRKSAEAEPVAPTAQHGGMLGAGGVIMVPGREEPSTGTLIAPGRDTDDRDRPEQ